ncbi:21.7 kDa class VI heat shock protein [Magnolia sinica]|uniref:21.7 kDa class VI heat shock protein n=1 Tax=Magnolia sinica TaxID=86752 RepID=UPI002659CDF2|nr:21.7 kDa class VI heat shock protein [Magnolia sinica]
MSMSARQALEIRSEDRTLNKWCVSLREDVFDSFISQGGNTLHKVFGDGSLFSPLLFGKFFDPSDAFPLWDFEAEILLSGIRSSAGSSVDWFVTETEYVLRAELPGVKKYDVQIYVENGKVVEISSQWRRWESGGKDWRSSNWWEFGYVRRIELPENANWRKIEAFIDDNHFLEIKILKNISENSNIPQLKNVEPIDSQFA